MTERKLSLGDRLAQILGRGKKWMLRRAEQLAYDVAGLPMALRRLGGGKRASPQQQPARFLHDVYGDFYWRWPGGPVKGVTGVILWPLALAVAIAVFTIRNGAAIRQRSGKSIARQVGEQVMVAARHAVAPFWYYMYELFDDDRRAKAYLYLTAHETIGPAYSLLQPPAGEDRMADKVWFANYCRMQGVHAVPVLMLLSGGAIAAADGTGAALPDADLFVKPREGNGGHNTERWDFIGEDRFRNSKGIVLAKDALVTFLCRQSLKDEYIVQPRLINHPDLADFSNDALATARVLTCRNEAGDFEATNAAFRMAIGGNSVVDNFHSGGIATEVDLRTGVIGAATDMGLKPDVGWRERHPVSGTQISGRRLPQWRDAMELACAAHRAFPQRTVVGWDVAFLADGPCIIEGNGKPDLDIHQRVERGPAGDGRIAVLLAMNLAKALAEPSGG